MDGGMIEKKCTACFYIHWGEYPNKAGGYFKQPECRKNPPSPDLEADDNERWPVMDRKEDFCHEFQPS